MELDDFKIKVILLLLLLAIAFSVWVLVDAAREIQDQLQANAINDELHRRTVIAEEKPAATIPRRRKKVEEADDADEEG